MKNPILFFLFVLFSGNVVFGQTPGTGSDPCSALQLYPQTTCGNTSGAQYAGYYQSENAGGANVTMNGTSTLNPTCTADNETTQAIEWLAVTATTTSFTITNQTDYGNSPTLSAQEPRDYVIYSGPCNSLTQVQCFANVAGGSSVNVTGLTVGQTYYIMVSQSASAYTACSTCTGVSTCITATVPFTPSNNGCSTPFNMTTNVQYTSTNANASADGPSVCQNPPSGSVENNVWYEWCAPSNWPAGQTAYLIVNNQVCNSTQGLQLSIYAPGASCANITAGTGTSLICQNPGSTTNYNYPFVANPNQCYLITLDGFAGVSCTYNIMVSGSLCALPVITATATNPTICAGNSTSLTASCTSNCTNITYTWSPSTGLSSTSGATVTASPTVTTTYTVSGSIGANCIGTQTVTVNVDPTNTVSSSSSNPTLCINTAISPFITFTTTGATGIGAASGLPTGVSASFSGNTITITGTPTAAGTFNYSIPLTGGCGTVTATGAITVDPINSVSAASTNPTVCIGSAIPTVSFTTTGATGIGSATGLPTGVNASWFNNTITISGTPSAVGTYNYTIPITGGCGAINATGTITVIALPTISLSSSGPFTCNASDGSITVSGTGIGNVFWSGPSSNSATNVPLNYTISNIGSGTYNVYFVNSSGCQSVTNQISLSNPGAPVLDIINDVTNCGTSYTLPTINGPSLTAPAYYTGPNGTGSVITVGTTYNAPTNITLYAYDANGACADEEPFTITINQIPSVNTPSNILVCPGATIDPQDFVSIPVGATYSWTNTNISVGLPSFGTGQINTFTSSANNTGSTLSATVTVIPTLNGCSGSSSSFTISIDPSPTVNPISDITACPGATLDPTDFSSTPSGATYTWTNSNNGIGLSASGSGQITPFTLGINNTGSNITSTITAIATLNGCTGPSQTYTISISPTPTLSLTPTDPTICNGANGSISVNTGGPGTVTWSGSGSGNSGPMNNTYLINSLSSGAYDIFYINSTTGCQSNISSSTLLNPGAPIIDPIANFTSCGGFYALQNITGTSLVNPQYYSQTGGNGSIINIGTLFQADTLITIYAYDANGSCTAEQSFTIELISNPVISNPGPQVACESYSLPLITGTSLSGNQAYFTDSQANGGTLITGPITSNQTIYIYDANGNCSDEEFFSITIENAPIISNPGPLSACESLSLPVIGGSNLSGAQAYYTNSQANGGVSTLGPITSSQTVYIYDSNGSCSDEEAFVVTINPNPTLGSFTGGGTYCQGDAVSDLIANVNGSPNYTLYYSINGVSQIPANSSTSTINLGSTAGIYVLDSLSDSNCVTNGLSATQIITINPIPSAPTAGTDTTYCSNATPIALTAAGNGTFTWYNSNNSVLGTGSTFIPNMTVGTTTYNVSQTTNNCEGPTSSVVVIVEDCGIIVPTAFTPDNDNTNDYWMLENIDQIYPKNVVTIFNRWGNQIYQSKAGQYESTPWDGNFKEQQMPVGSYYYIIEYNDDYTENTTGIVSILK
jgi:gliding motility-associated-like protein